jgi:hypothetical protein
LAVGSSNEPPIPPLPLFYVELVERANKKHTFSKQPLQLSF